MIPAPSAPLIRQGDDWRAILSFNLYRSLIGFGLVALLLFGATTSLFNVTMLDLFRLATLIYLAQCALAVAATLSRRPRRRAQIILACAVDVVFFTCLTLASDGVAGGLGMLLLAPVAAAGILLPARQATLIAACAAIGVLGQEGWHSLYTPDGHEEFVQAGILGILFFITMVLGHWLSQRARLSEALADERAGEIRDLASLNLRIIQQMEIGAVIVDHDQRIEILNDEAVTLLDMDAVPAPGADLRVVAPALANALARWRAYPGEAGESVQIGQQSLLPTFSQLGWGAHEPTLIFIENAARQYEQAQQLKLISIGRLTANIAHEIRNPLGAISHAGQLLAESEAITGADGRLLDIIHRHTRRIDAIINNVMGLSQRSPRNRKRLGLASWLSQTIAVYRETAEQAPIFDIEAINTVQQIDFDPDHLRQLLFNLWDNAQRHARQKDKHLHIRLIGNRTRAQRFCLDVVDNGPGIDDAIVDSILEPFFTTTREGTGLGLHIAAELCEANGARLLPVAQMPGACFRIVFAHTTIDAGNPAPPLEYKPIT